MTGDMNIAAKPDTKSGYIIRPGPYCVFTNVNRKEIMNIYPANIAKTAAIPEVGSAARTYPGLRPGRTAGRSSGIRSSGQYCCPQELTGTGPQMTACRGNRGRTAIDGMCS